MYDSVDLTVVVVGDLPFSRLFREPLPALAEHAKARFAEAHREGLLPRPEVAAEAVERAVEAGPRLTLEAVLSEPREQLPGAVVEGFVELRRFGFCLPLLETHDDGKRRKARDRLIDAAPELTYAGLFTTPASRASAKTLGAIRAVREAGLLAGLSNDRCCAKGKGPSGVGDACNANPDTWCNLTGLDGELCSIASTPCPAPP